MNKVYIASFTIISGTAGDQSTSHNLENNIAVLRELAHCVRFKWEMLCGYMRRRPPHNCGEVRSAVVKVKSGNMPSSEWRRPLQRLYPLEVKLNTELDNAVPITFVRDGDIPAVVVNPI